MGSGCFPIKSKQLKEAARLIDEVVNNYYNDVYSGESGCMQYDNTASDGGSLALLNLASKLIKGEIDK